MKKLGFGVLMYSESLSLGSEIFDAIVFRRERGGACSWSEQRRLLGRGGAEPEFQVCILLDLIKFNWKVYFGLTLSLYSNLGFFSFC